MLELIESVGTVPLPLGERCGVSYLWYDQSADRKDVFPLEKGYGTALVTAHDRDEMVGYLKISYSTEALVAAVFDDPLEFFCRHRGWCLPLKGTRTKLWKTLHLYGRTCPESLQARGEYVAGWALTDEHAPSAAEMESDIASFEAEARAGLAVWFERARAPVVAFSRVADDCRRRGIASAMYEHGARQLAERGELLRASTLRSFEAEAFWSHLCESDEYPTRFVTVEGVGGGEPKTVPALDYRSGTCGGYEVQSGS